MGGALEAAFDFAASPGVGSVDVNGVRTDNKTRFQIQGLDPTLTYDFSFFGSHQYEGDVATVYSVYTDNTYTTLAGTANLNVRDAVDPSLHNRDTIATIANLVPAANTILYVQFVGDTGDLGYLNSMRIVASGVAPGMAGDYNANGVVDAADYVAWRNASPTATLPNDSTPGVVDSSDYATWKANFGKTPGRQRTWYGCRSAGAGFYVVDCDGRDAAHFAESAGAEFLGMQKPWSSISRVGRSGKMNRFQRPERMGRSAFARSWNCWS